MTTIARPSVLPRPPMPAIEPFDLVAAERAQGVAQALKHITNGMPGRAHYELARSVMRQARIVGLGDVALEVCPCGGGCRP